MQPTYFVKHPDDTYSEANPQPILASQDTAPPAAVPAKLMLKTGDKIRITKDGTQWANEIVNKFACTIHLDPGMTVEFLEHAAVPAPCDWKGPDRKCQMCNGDGVIFCTEQAAVPAPDDYDALHEKHERAKRDLTALVQFVRDVRDATEYNPKIELDDFPTEQQRQNVVSIVRALPGMLRQSARETDNAYKEGLRAAAPAQAVDALGMERAARICDSYAKQCVGPMSFAAKTLAESIRTALAAQPAAHTDDAAVDRFAAAMKAKMAASRAKGRGGWDDPAQCRVEKLAAMLVQHVEKGDPVDIANFAMMVHQRGGTAIDVYEALAVYLKAAPAGEPVAKQANPHAATFPPEIWLNMGDCDADECTAWPDIEHRREITWCWESIDRMDVHYIRADIAAPVANAGQAQDKSGWDSKTLVTRLYNDPPTYGLLVEAGAEIQALRQQLAAKAGEAQAVAVPTEAMLRAHSQNVDGLDPETARKDWYAMNAAAPLPQQVAQKDGDPK